MEFQNVGAISYLKRDGIRTVHIAWILSDTVGICLYEYYRADHAAVSSRHLENCGEEGIFGTIFLLSAPMKLKLSI